ncbi:MAG: hypothetical protein AAF533_08195 [Acidobacteriota bacterium]
MSRRPSCLLIAIALLVSSPSLATEPDQGRSLLISKQLVTDATTGEQRVIVVRRHQDGTMPPVVLATLRGADGREVELDLSALTPGDDRWIAASQGSQARARLDDAGLRLDHEGTELLLAPRDPERREIRVSRTKDGFLVAHRHDGTQVRRQPVALLQPPTLGEAELNRHPSVQGLTGPDREAALGRLKESLSKLDLGTLLVLTGPAPGSRSARPAPASRSRATPLR